MADSGEAGHSDTHFIHFTGEATWLNEVVYHLPETELRACPDGDVAIDCEAHYEKLFAHLLHSPSFQKM